ncbi:DNA cytosine methyltransferase [Comamonas sp. JNW]|uniref:DNA cytosine methyltransferase n=1 Tax=Comamonas sp. JNW TaxID=2170731 RepID=UPI000DE6A7A9|nr:DNA cytosine methyltransferase [Comamonas sp. JNW]PWB21362.1 DNA cytosine methyltransferase [Comamonas sp. JNW]
MDTIEFGSVCSGIEAASVAWHPLGWRAAWLAEIEPFPAAALAHHYPTVPNLGDMTTIARRVLIGEVSAPDVLAGGTPCQAFSVAGLRNSLDDARGNLTLKFVELANAIDLSRSRAGKSACVIKWENVPGVLNTKDNAFGCFLAGLAGEDDPLQPPGGKWSNAGCVYGPTRAVAWRTLDAQYFGVAQRRRRVFVVSSARPGFDPAQVLFEWDGMRRDSAPSREAGEETAHSVAPCLTGSGRGVGRIGDTRGQDPVVACFGGNRTSGPLDVSTALNASGTASGRQDFESETFVVHGSQDPDTLRDMAHTLGRNQGQENAVYAVRTAQTSANGHGIAVEVTHTLDQAQGQAVCVPHVDIMPTLRSGGGSKASHGAVSGDTKDEYVIPVYTPGIAGTLVARSSRGAGQTNSPGHQADQQLIACTASQVRRLTPVECERLQGFPDGYTAIPWRGKPADQCPDGPRYKALGNSWAVPVARWIGRRIHTQLLTLEATRG